MTQRSTTSGPAGIPTGEAGAVLKADIEAQINGGDWTAGFRLPGERTLAAQYGVSRAVVREVLRTLQVQGMIQVSPARGAFVRRPDGSALSGALTQILRTHGATVRDVAEARALLETEVTTRAAARRGGDLIDGLAQIAEDIDSGQDRVLQAIGDLKFHAMLCLAGDNAVLTAMYRAIAPYVLFMTLRLERDHQAGGARHTQIVDAVRRGDVTAARDLSTAHLQVTQRYFDSDFDRPVEEVARENLARISAGLWTIQDVERRAYAELDALLIEAERPS